jgi:hypothetical protein
MAVTRWHKFDKDRNNPIGYKSYNFVKVLTWEAARSLLQMISGIGCAEWLGMLSPCFSPFYTLRTGRGDL